MRVFVRVVELGSITAAGRDQRLSPAVASNRIKELEQRLGVRLFNRTTRKLTPTEIGHVFYEHAITAIEAINAAEAAAASFSGKPQGAVRALAPLGLGRRIVGPLIPEFHERYPDVDVRLRLSDRSVDLLGEGLDVAFALGEFQDSSLKIKQIAEAPRVLCAAPSYLEQFGTPGTPSELLTEGHRCLLLRYPGSQEFYWTLKTPAGPEKFNVKGPYDADDGDVLTDWAVAGRGIINKPRFEVAGLIASGALTPILEATPPPPSRFACLYPHRRLLDPKVRLFIDFMVERCKISVKALTAASQSERAKCASPL